MAHPAKPTQAINLISPHELQDHHPTKRRRLGTGCANVDAVLDGGLVYGEGGICCMSAIPGSNILETMSRNILTTHLLCTTHPATIIDTKGNFDVLLLYRGILSRLQTLYPSLTQEELANRATTALDRVKIMRVFDFEGVAEGVGEFRMGLLERKQGMVRGTVGDSQDEGEEDLLAEVERVQQQDSEVDVETEGGLLVVDDLSVVVGALLKGDFVKGQARLTEFMRGLRGLATEYGVAVLLLVASVTYKEDTETPSVFSGIKSRPGLGKTFGYLVDTQVLVDGLPRRKDSREWVNVVEVLHSRGVHEEGKFGFFVIEEAGELRDVM